MGDLKWYKRDPDAALNGMADMNLSERGAYNTVLDLIYSRGGQVADDDVAVAAVMRCDVRRWRQLRAAFIEAGKIYTAGGFLRNKRADREVTNARTRMQNPRKFPAKSRRFP